MGYCTPYQNTIGAAFGSKRIYVLGRKINIGIWDTSGSERYEPISKLYYKTAQAAILCYNPKDIDSYHKLIFWLQEISQNQPGTKMYICATKIDLVKNDPSERLIEQLKINELALEFHAKVFETSAKSGENVKLLFRRIAKDFVLQKSTIFKCHKNNNCCLIS